MATCETCELIVCLDISPWYSETKEHVLFKGTMSTIDSYTLRYKNSFEFYESIKNDVIKKVNNESLMNIGLLPTEVKLSSRGIYIYKDGRPIRALFKEMDYGERVYSLQDLIFYAMSKGGLKYLYLCDKKRVSEETDYQSFFKDTLRYVSERLEIDGQRKSDYIYVLKDITSKRRYSEVARFLLRFLSLKLDQITFDEIYSMFVRDVSNYEVFERKNETEKSNDNVGYYYRWPYKD